MEAFLSSTSSPTTSGWPFAEEQPQQQHSSLLDSSGSLPVDGEVPTDHCRSGSNRSNSLSSDHSSPSSSTAVTAAVLVDSVSSTGESESYTSSAGEGNTTRRRLLSPCGVAVPPAPPSSPEPLLVLPARVKSSPSASARHSAAAAAAAALAFSSSSPTPSMVMFPSAHTTSASSSISTCSSHNRRPSYSSSNVPSPREMASPASSPFAALSPTSVQAGSSPACLHREQPAVGGPLASPSMLVTCSSPSRSLSVRVDAVADAPYGADANATQALPTFSAASAAESEVPAREPLTNTKNCAPPSPETADLYPVTRASLPPPPLAAATPAAPVSTAAAVAVQSASDTRLPVSGASAAGTVSCPAGAPGSHTAATTGDFCAAAEAGVFAPPAAAASSQGAGNTAVPAAAVPACEPASAAATPSDERPATVVLDTGAFLRLQQLGGSSALLQAEKRLLSRRRQQQHSDVQSKPPRRIQFVAPASVLLEIRDARSRTRALQQQQWAAAAADSSLPLVMAATEADKRWARTFAAKTGDLPALSSTDLDVIALTYMLQRQTGQVQGLRHRPVETMCIQPRCHGSNGAAVAAGDRAPVCNTRRGTGGSVVPQRRAAAGGTVATGERGIIAGGEGAAASTENRATPQRGKAAAPEGTAKDEEEDAGVSERQQEKRVVAIEEGTQEREGNSGAREQHEKEEAEAKSERGTTPDAYSGATPEPAAYEGAEQTLRKAGMGLCGGGVKETCDLVEFDSDEEDDGEGKWISLENIEQLKRNANACVLEESGFPSALPPHGAATSSISSKSGNHAKRDIGAALPAAAEGQEAACTIAAAALEDAVVGVPSREAEHNEECDGTDFLVACKTTDYSVQNVLLHMGLNVLAIDGYAIRSLKTWALLCRACQHVTRDVSHLFCPKCGQHAVDRVPVSFDGKEYVVFDNRKKKCTRGLVHSLPKPKGGRHEKQLILAEDQLLMGGRDRLLRHQQRVWESENAEHNFFGSNSAMDPASWYSRTRTRTGRPATGFQAPHVVVGLGPGNPNSNRWIKKHATARTRKNN